MDLNNIIFFFVLLFLVYICNKYILIILNKFNPKLLIDDQFQKPQAFHQTPTYISGGLSIFFSLLLVYLYLFFYKDITYYEYISFCTLIFFLGFIEDLKINFNPIVRLFLMIVFLILLTQYNNIFVEKTGIEILNNWLQNSSFFSLIFICLCFLFVINGANLIDGYNGLLGIHSLIILINLFFINYLNGNTNLAYILFYVILILIIFLKFNFPTAKIFLGDGGSYLLGAFIALSAIQTSIMNPTISPFYFCILLFYLFFEVFFSFIRKLVFEKKSPIRPDKNHLHMILYKVLCKKINNKLKSNYYVSIIINLIFLILIIPAIFMMKNGLFCKYYSLIFFIIYIFSYGILANKQKSYEKN